MLKENELGEKGLWSNRWEIRTKSVDIQGESQLKLRKQRLTSFVTVVADRRNLCSSDGLWNYISSET